MLGGLSRNAPSSDARVVTDRYRVSEYGGTLRVSLLIEDEKFLTRGRPTLVRISALQILLPSWDPGTPHTARSNKELSVPSCPCT